MPDITPYTRRITMACLSLVMVVCIFKGEMAFANNLLIFIAAIFKVRGD